MDTTPIVAVASSAGDVDAVSELLAAFPGVCGAAFVIVQHLDLGREKLPVRALAAGSTFPVLPAHDGVVPQRDHVYVMTAGTTLTMEAGCLRVVPKASGLHQPGDILFTSLAEQCGDGAIGVVLSGTGSDGARGVRAISQGGGIVVAQYPGSARFPSMPINAIDTGCVGFVLRPNEIARELTRLSGCMRPAPHSRTSRIVAPRPADPNPEKVINGGLQSGSLS